MFLNEKRNLNLNGAIFLFSSFFCAGFATMQVSLVPTKGTNSAVPCNPQSSRLAVINGAEPRLSAEQKFMRTRPPSAYCVRIESCSELMTRSPNLQYETRPFSVGGFNWTFILQPFGNKTSVGDWISAYVAIDPSGLVGENREVYADLRFLVYSKSKDQYWTSMDTEIRHFHQFRTTWGSPNFIQTKQFKAKDKEYIFDDDQCVFGVDISVYPYFNQWEILSIDKTVYGPNSWKLMKFSTLTRDFYISDDFSVGGKNWAFKVYPNGNGTGEGNSLSLYVILSENQILKTYEKVYVRAKLRVLDQKQSKHLQKPILSWFDTPGEGSGFEQFVSFTDLQNPAKGFIVDDSLTVQVQFEATSSTNYYSANAAQLMSNFFSIGLSDTTDALTFTFGDSQVQENLNFEDISDDVYVQQLSAECVVKRRVEKLVSRKLSRTEASSSSVEINTDQSNSMVMMTSKILTFTTEREQKQQI
ncbi:BnaA05g15960D [Brassica napus]|uniref:(rape) hypothetical protein n=1 Tax=Brassica napus TaxID=3708 RepID=A0A078GVY8_BRANA|nr:unnamed protein product [Brassica napus]CDY29329.1 BnaA05g15960D [Brassica napus]